MTIEEMMRKLKANPNTQEVTKAEMILGSMRSKRYTSDDVIRCLENDEIIEFTNPKYSGENVEFEINNNQNHKIWLSQLQGVFINHKNRDEIYGGVIKLKDSTEKLMLTLSSQGFYELVKGRKFKVSLDQNAIYMIDKKDERVISLLKKHNGNYSRVVDYIFEKLDTEEYDLIEGMTKLGRCYDLTEI